jgi:hypothetical protein
MKSSAERTAILEKTAFTERLKQAIADFDAELLSPTVLAREFKRRSRHSTVGVTAAHKWLTGEAIPMQEKLLVLAAWLQVSVQWLRYGEAELQPKVSGREQRRAEKLVSEFSELSERDKVLIEKLVREMLHTKE